MKRLHLALLLLPAPELLADTRDQALTLPDVVISANRQVQARNDSSAANTVFTRDDIDRLQPTSLTDLLSRVPGVQIAPTGGRGSLPGVYIRGTKSAQSLVLVDGQRIANTAVVRVLSSPRPEPFGSVDSSKPTPSSLTRIVNAPSASSRASTST